MALKKLACALIATIVFARGAEAVDFTLPPEAWETEIDADEIWNAIRDANWNYVTDLLTEALRLRIRQELNTQKNIPVLMRTLVKELNRIFDDPSMPVDEKKNAILLLINNTLEDHASAPAGQLNVVMRHSVEHGVTKLEWDAKVHVDECEGAVVRTVCNDPLNPGSCQTYIDYFVEYVRREPNYRIYRILNGQETLLTTMWGQKTVRKDTYSFGSSIWKNVREAVDLAFGDDFAYPSSPDRVFFYDFSADYREKGTSLAYRIVSSDAFQKHGNCGTVHNYESTVVADADGDGLMDYIPRATYQKYFSKYYGWLTPVITSVLN